MPEDWKPGDLALCVRTGNFRTARRGLLRMVLGPWREHGLGPRSGSYHVVVGFGESDPLLPKDAFPLLMFAAWATDAWDHRAFRKVRPSEADEFDRETIALLTGKPVKEPA